MTAAASELPLVRSSEGYRPCTVQVWGEAALFTRPEFKAERVTYPVITPSAAVGVLEAIFWKPEIRYRVVAIEVLNPIRRFSIRRNETTDVISLAQAAHGVRRVDTVAHRDQRNAVCLRDVAYRIHAHIELRPTASRSSAGYRDQLRRRVQSGACFQRPYLGAREFSAEFGPPNAMSRLEELNEDLGIMIHSIHYQVDGRAQPQWFAARIDRGVVHVPADGVESPAPVSGAG